MGTKRPASCPPRTANHADPKAPLLTTSLQSDLAADAEGETRGGGRQSARLVAFGTEEVGCDSGEAEDQAM